MLWIVFMVQKRKQIIQRIAERRMNDTPGKVVMNQQKKQREKGKYPVSASEKNEKKF